MAFSKEPVYSDIRHKHPIQTDTTYYLLSIRSWAGLPIKSLRESSGLRKEERGKWGRARQNLRGVKTRTVEKVIWNM